MKVLEYKQYNNSDDEKVLNKKKVFVAGIILFLVIFSAIISVVYITSAGFRNFMDKYVLLKSVTENNLPYVNIESKANINITAYKDYIAILENDNLSIYNSSAKNVENLKIEISSPIFATKDKYLVIAEKNQRKIYLIKNKKILWEKDIEGQISRINVNKNGYVSVIVSGTSFKSVIVTYAEDGSEVFKTFLSSTVAIDSDISNDNKFLSFCEMNISGSLVQCVVKTISIEKAKQDPQNSIIHTYELPLNSIITNMEYHEKEELLAITDSKIYLLKNGEITELHDITDYKITFSGIKLQKSYFKIVENINGINNQKSNVEIFSTNNKNSYVYEINGIAKEVYSAEGVIVVNLGSEVYLINETGWLIKKYTSSQEIKDVVISENIVGIIYRNKIEFISL